MTLYYFLYENQTVPSNIARYHLIYKTYETRNQAVNVVPLLRIGFAKLTRLREMSH